MPAETQQDFVNAIFDASRPAIDGARDPNGDRAPKRFNVYRNNVVVSLIEALGEGFPLVKRLVGEEFFSAMAKKFAITHPPNSPLMFLYGEDFPKFVEGYQPADSVPYLADIARLEYARREAYFAADENYLDRSQLAGVDEEALLKLRLEPHPSVHVVKSSYPIFSIYEKLNGRGEVVQSAQEVLIFRDGFEVKTIQTPDGFKLFFHHTQIDGIGAAVEKVMNEHTKTDIPAMVSLAIETSVSYA